LILRETQKEKKRNGLLKIPTQTVNEVRQHNKTRKTRTLFYYFHKQREKEREEEEEEEIKQQRSSSR
jgi:hypothetical protein